MDLTVVGDEVVDRNRRVTTVTALIPEDAAMAKLVADARAPFFAVDVQMEHPTRWIDLPLVEPVDTVIGTTDVLLHRRHVPHDPVNEMLAEVTGARSSTLSFVPATPKCLPEFPRRECRYPGLCHNRR
jgi:hypothetical protein